jgi:hypothetical protein
MVEEENGFGRKRLCILLEFGKENTIKFERTWPNAKQFEIKCPKLSLSQP